MKLGAAAGAVAALALLVFVRGATAQLVPDDEWRTLRTEHFNVHFPAPLEAAGRRAAAAAEASYALLAGELVPPRGRVELVIADNVDFTNGYATVYPSNRIVLYLHPPVETLALRTYDDWIELVTAHELAHVFHLDRTRGWWRLAQGVLGRNPLLFPNVYLPTWLLEGLAVYYETRLTGSGRLAGTYHDLIARSAAIAGAVPRLSDLNPGTSRFPGGEAAYAYGSLLFEHLADTRGDSSVRAFIERSSGMPFPFLLGRSARRSFGVSFERAFRQWRDSLLRAAPREREPMPAWRDLTRSGRYAFFPRWSDDSALVFSASTGRESPGAYRVTLTGRTQRVGRVNTLDVSAPLAGGGELFAQQDFIGPYRVRSDLYLRRGATERRLTRGARLSHPDVRHDGAIVAVQATAGSTRLVRLALDNDSITPLTEGSFTEQWAEPRWSPGGGRIAAVRLERGRSEIVVLDSAGVELSVVAGGNAVHASPAWADAGRVLYFTSDESGAPQVYVVDVATGAVRRLSDAATGLHQPAPSSDGRTLAANVYRADGLHIGVAPRPGSEIAVGSTVADTARCPRCEQMQARVAEATARVTALEVRRYSAFPSILPRYWLPLVSATEDRGTSVGGFTSGTDVVGRHSYAAQALVNTRSRETDFSGWYRYAGLGQPLLDLIAGQEWERSSLVNSADVIVGSLSERRASLGVRASFVRRRVRTSAIVSAGFELESRRYSTSPDTLLRLLPPLLREGVDYPAVNVTAAWSNAQRPSLSISPEDGASASSSFERRWSRGGDDASSNRTIAVISAYKSLDLPGFAHHVLALRSAAGVTDGNTTSLFSAGGVSGAVGYSLIGSIGEGQRTFGVRGYPAGAERGTRAYALTAEYRLPLAAPSRRLPLVPLFVDRISASLFAESGRAYCPARDAATCAPIAARNPMMTSIGGEIAMDTPAQLVAPYRIRAGVAHPLRERARFRASAAEWYVTFGHVF